MRGKPFQGIDEGIAEYMEGSIQEYSAGGLFFKAKDGHDKPLFSEDLNSLVPVWEKMKDFGINFRFDSGEWAQSHSYYLIDSCNDEYGRGKTYVDPKGLTIQQYAAKATLKAIEELNETSN